MNELDLIIDKLPLEVDGHRLQIWRKKEIVRDILDIFCVNVIVGK